MVFNPGLPFFCYLIQLKNIMQKSKETKYAFGNIKISKFFLLEQALWILCHYLILWQLSSKGELPDMSSRDPKMIESSSTQQKNIIA